MPVEIKELIIRAVADHSAVKQAEDSGSAGDDPKLPNDQNSSSQALVEECVQQVLRILDRGRER